MSTITSPGNRALRAFLKRSVRPAAASLLVGLLSANGIIAQEFMAGGDNTLVQTEAGQLVGIEHDGVFNYRGVRYATAARFMPPEKVAPWEGVQPAVTYGQNCFIPDLTAVAGDDLFNPHRYMPMSEDCLFLNVWTPGLDDGAKRPVMVWVHGGGYTNGSGVEIESYDGENLSQSGDVVVITLNHRLNVLGFLDLSEYGDEYENSGNNSMADLVTALEWVKANAAAFGGDPDNVTIFGQSGGGSKVRTLMGLPAAQGLFAKAIVQSGATSSPVTDQESSRRVAALTLENLGLTADQIGELKELPYRELLAAATDALAAAKEEGLANPRWAPVVDGAYLPADPVGEKWTDLSADVPLLIGTVLNESETIIRNNPAALFADNKNGWTDEHAMEKLTERFADKAQGVADAFLAAYPEKKLADAFFVDVNGRAGTLRNTLLKAEQDAPVFNYVFTWESPVMGGIGMSWHCSEIHHVFNNAELVSGATGGGPDAIAMSEKVSQAWVNFARNGNPSHEGLLDWPEFTAESGATMILDNESVVRNHHDAELLDLATQAL